MLPYKAFLLLFLGLIGSGFVLANILPECRDIENSKKFVASQSSCAKYVFCDGVDSFEGECLDNNYFNELEGNCVEAHEIECKLQGQANVASIFDKATTALANNISNRPGLVNALPPQVTNTNVADSWHQWPVLYNVPTTVAKPTNAAATWNDWTLSTTDAVTPQCPLLYGVSNIIHLPNPASCSAYFTCYNGIAVPMMCARNMHFNANTAKCERSTQVQCELVEPVRLVCRPGIYDFIPHPRNCEYYYLCANGFLMIMQCPFNFTWHYENRVCVHRSQSKCFSHTILQTMLYG